MKTQFIIPQNATFDAKLKYIGKFIEDVTTELKEELELEIKKSKNEQLKTKTELTESINKVSNLTDPNIVGSISTNRAGNSIIGACSTTTGYNNIASGICAKANGRETSAIGNYSTTNGLGTIARSNFQQVFGTYNEEDSNNEYVEIVGNGGNDEEGNINRSNARMLDWAGNEILAGNLYVNETKKVATQEDVLLLLQSKVPNPPKGQGTYILKAEVSGKDKIKYYWEKELR